MDAERAKRAVAAIIAARAKGRADAALFVALVARGNVGRQLELRLTEDTSANLRPREDKG